MTNGKSNVDCKQRQSAHCATDASRCTLSERACVRVILTGGSKEDAGIISSINKHKADVLNQDKWPNTLESVHCLNRIIAPCKLAHNNNANPSIQRRTNGTKWRMVCVPGDNRARARAHSIATQNIRISMRTNVARCTVTAAAMRMQPAI